METKEKNFEDDIEAYLFSHDLRNRSDGIIKVAVEP